MRAHRLQIDVSPRSLFFIPLCGCGLFVSLAVVDAQSERQNSTPKSNGRTTDKSPSASVEFEKEQVRRWMQFYEEEASGYEILLGGDSKKKLVLQREPVIRWTNPVVGNGTTHGACFVWTNEGRPEVFASIFSYIPSRSSTKDKRRVAHALHSLSLQTLVAKRAGERFWNPEEPGIEPKPIPGAPQPAQSPSSRLVQMRQLARQFSAKASQKDNERELRLLSQPVYRYGGRSPHVLDGGVFCFVTGTDPEVLMLIEARKNATGTQWAYAFARHTGMTLRVYHKGEEVWNHVRGGPHSGADDPKHRYLSVHGTSIRDNIIK